jgi:hypothetical protein
MSVHRFRRSLGKSHKWADAPWWDEVYEAAFPGCIRQDMREDGWWQRAGIDKLLHLPNATTVSVDEKVREEYYPDFAIEYFHVPDVRAENISTRDGWNTARSRGRLRDGWIKTAACDYLAYAWVPRRRCYLLPMRDLQRAWEREKYTWWDLAEKCHGGFRFIDADNDGEFGGRYVTRSVAVPVTVLLASIQRSMEFTWSAGQEDVA